MCSVEKRGTEDATAVRDRLMWVACTVPWGHVMSGPVLQPRACLGLWPYCSQPVESVIMSMARVLGSHLRPSWCLGAMLPSGPY